MDWSPVRTGRLATGDCNKKIHVWEPQVWKSVGYGGPRGAPSCRGRRQEDQCLGLWEPQGWKVWCGVGGEPRNSVCILGWGVAGDGITSRRAWLRKCRCLFVTRSCFVMTPPPRFLSTCIITLSLPSVLRRAGGGGTGRSAPPPLPM